MSVDGSMDTHTDGVYQQLRCFHIRLFDHGSRRARNLYDVDGNILADENGVRLNIWSQTMNEYLMNGTIRLIHRLGEPAYSYFVISEEQRQRFEYEREHGSGKRMIYHVYADDDIDWRCPDCRHAFINPKK